MSVGEINVLKQQIIILLEERVKLGLNRLPLIIMLVTLKLGIRTNIRSQLSDYQLEKSCIYHHHFIKVKMTRTFAQVTGM